ncbi:DUF3095 domain-containing protein [Antarcticimicrobium sediminis]|uniref:DUF3095 domain-containing protein n=2 Tax=Antarcticimicrobium sediminis TaxID=2546227 RepID=A0A4R5ESD1_9RHOB|nr:DUF3095 domain-containing protein [Antarcticimicrobium sediminis]
MGENGFYDRLRPRTDFAELVAEDCFAPVPADWLVGVADIVNSTGEIEKGRYKTVNMAGAAVIAAMMNAMQGRAFPFVFGGDGASFAVRQQDAGLARDALAAVRRWAQEAYGLDMRAALVGVSDIRAAGHDLRVARYATSQGVDYAMFSGGGLAWAEARMKAGNFDVPPAPEGTQPDLSGLSCRWANLRAQNGRILSLVVLPAPGGDLSAFAAVAHQVVEIADALNRGGHPVPETGPQAHWPPSGFALEAQARRAGASLLRREIELLGKSLVGWLLFKTGLRVGGFDPGRYTAQVSANADFRKFDDGLKMTLDCDVATCDRIKTVLKAAAATGAIQYGAFEQDEALITCFVPSALHQDHVHFIDGAAGGYARAASQIKSARSKAA